MSEGPATTPFGGLLLVLCPLLCLALPPLLIAGVGAVLTWQVGIAFASVGLGSLAALGILVLRRRRARELCCAPPDHANMPGARERHVTRDRSLAEATKR